MTPSMILINLQNAAGWKTMIRSSYKYQFSANLTPSGQRCQTVQSITRREFSLNMLHASIRVRLLVSASAFCPSASAEPIMSCVIRRTPMKSNPSDQSIVPYYILLSSIAPYCPFYTSYQPVYSYYLLRRILRYLPISTCPNY